MGRGDGDLSDIRFGNRTWWLTMATIIGFGVIFAVWLGVDIATERQLDNHGVVVEATIKDIRPLRKSHECLAAYTLNGRSYQQWSDNISHCQIGGQNTIIVDARDRRPLMSKDLHDRGWLWHVPQLLAMVISAWIAMRFYHWSKLWL